MAFTSADLAAIEAAIATGATTVALANGTTMTYKNTDALMKVRTLMEQELGITKTTKGFISVHSYSDDEQR